MLRLRVSDHMCGRIQKARPCYCIPVQVQVTTRAFISSLFQRAAEAPKLFLYIYTKPSFSRASITIRFFAHLGDQNVGGRLNPHGKLPVLSQIILQRMLSYNRGNAISSEKISERRSSLTPNRREIRPLSFCMILLVLCI